MRTARPDSIQVLHVEDEPSFADITADMLTRENEDMEVLTETNATDGLERLADAEVDCVLSDYNMPGRNGIEFLEAVRENYPDLPFILFTGRGSEEVASDAISAGVTDYLQKGSGSDKYAVLANRIENAVHQHQMQAEVEANTRWYSTLLEHSSDYMMVVDEYGDVEYISPAVERVLGYDPEELDGENSFDQIHPDDVQRAVNTVAEVIENPDEEHTVEFRARHADGSWVWIEVRGQSLIDDPVVEGVLVNVRDITVRKEREKALARQKERLENIASFMSHDVRNQLSIINGRLDLMQEVYDSDHVKAARRAVVRVEEMIDKLMQFAQGDELVTETEPVDLGAVVDRSWQSIEREGAELVNTSDMTLEADPERLQALIENLLLNALDHAGIDVTIRVGELEENTGFYVADDGPGVDDSEYDSVFNLGFSTDADGTGLGLAIVKQISEMHDWTIRLTESGAGGARFEIETA